MLEQARAQVTSAQTNPQVAGESKVDLTTAQEALARKKGRENLARRKDELIDQIAELEAQKEAGTVPEKKFKQELKDLKFQLSKVLEKLR